MTRTPWSARRSRRRWSPRCGQRSCYRPLAAGARSGREGGGGPRGRAGRSYLLVAALARFGRPGRRDLLWRAREATPETRAGVDVEQLARAGVERVRARLAALARAGGERGSRPRGRPGLAGGGRGRRRAGSSGRLLHVVGRALRPGGGGPGLTVWGPASRAEPTMRPSTGRPRGAEAEHHTLRYAARERSAAACAVHRVGRGWRRGRRRPRHRRGSTRWSGCRRSAPR